MLDFVKTEELLKSSPYYAMIECLLELFDAVHTSKLDKNDTGSVDGCGRVE